MSLLGLISAKDSFQPKKSPKKGKKKKGGGGGKTLKVSPKNMSKTKNRLKKLNLSKTVIA
jgi:hypothetical protein